MANLFPLDTQAEIVEVKDEKTNGKVSFYFLTLWNALTARIEQAAYRIGNGVTLAAQQASILATPLGSATLGAGLYRVSWYARITTPDGVSSSLTVTIRWTEGAVALALSGAAMTGDTVTTVQSGIVFLNVDNNTPITYATAYLSNTPGQMQYELVLALERVG